MSNEFPEHPILSIDEVHHQEDLRELVPELYGLRDGERVVSVSRIDTSRPKGHPSAVRAITRLAGVDHLSELGQSGPTKSSMAPEHMGDVPSLNKYEHLHGRDSMITAYFLRERHPNLLHATLLKMAERQGVLDEVSIGDQPTRQEEVGKIPHMIMDMGDPVAKKFKSKLGWDWPFYGTIDATPLFSKLLADEAHHKPEILDEVVVNKASGSEVTLAQSLDEAVAWIERKMSQNREGFVEFQNPRKKGGIRNQSWKDSDYAYIHADGSMANHGQGIASVEVQALAYDALMSAAAIEQIPGRSESLATKARQLQEAVLRHFWVENESDGYLALGTDRDEHGQPAPMRVRTSNMGQVLNSGLLEGTEYKPHVEKIVQQLFSEELLSEYGIRTLATDEVAYRPGGYHTGTVWLWDNYYIANGLERHGYPALAHEIRSRAWQAIEDSGYLPENVRGEHDRESIYTDTEVYVYDSDHDILHLYEQPPQLIQAWTVAGLLETKYKYAVNGGQHEPNDFEAEILDKLDW